MPLEPPDNHGIDWTGVRPDDSPIEPLDGRSFVLRLRRLEDHVHDLTRLRQALTQRQTNDRAVSRNPE